MRKVYVSYVVEVRRLDENNMPTEVSDADVSDVVRRIVFDVEELPLGLEIDLDLDFRVVGVDVGEDGPCHG